MTQRIVSAVVMTRNADKPSALHEMARLAIVAGGAVALILAGPFHPF